MNGESRTSRCTRLVLRSSWLVGMPRFRRNASRAIWDQLWFGNALSRDRWLSVDFREFLPVDFPHLVFSQLPPIHEVWRRVHVAR